MTRLQEDWGVGRVLNKSSSKSKTRAGLSRRDCSSVIDSKSVGWTLGPALEHLRTAGEGRLLPLVDQHGMPQFYSQADRPATFTALSRAIVGQQLGGPAAATIWKRFEAEVGLPVEPSKVQEKVGTDEEHGSPQLEEFRKTVGLSNAKMRALRSLSEFYLEVWRRI